jgi:hypothetical protein
MADAFAAEVADWERKCAVVQSAVQHEALRGLDQTIVEGTPEVTGNLRNSRAVSTLGPVTVDWRTKKFRDPSDTIDNDIAGSEVGQTVHLGFRAPYAHKIEPKYAMMRLAAQHWPMVVAEAARVVKSRG